MKKVLLILILTIITVTAFAQEVNNGSKQAATSVDRFPVFANCENLQSSALENCFYNEVQNFVFENFVVPENLVKNNFQGQIKVLFEVDATGVFRVIYVNAIDETLIDETKRVFGKFPEIAPSTYNGNPTYSKFNITILIPLKKQKFVASNAIVLKSKNKNKNIPLSELDSIGYNKFNSPQFESHLSIPFSHSYYAQFDAELNQLGSNNHTASKPYTYAEVSKYYNFELENEKIKKNVSGWWARQ